MLWKEYQKTGNQKALDTLLAYNVQDTVNLEYLMVTAYNLKIKETPFNNSHLIPSPSVPDNPYSADLETVNRISDLGLGIQGIGDNLVFGATSQVCILSTI